MTADNKVDLNAQPTDDNSDNTGSTFDVDSFFSQLEKGVNGAVYDEPEAGNTDDGADGVDTQEPVGSADETVDATKELENLQKRYDASSREAKRLAKKVADYEGVDDLLPVVRVIQQDPTLLRTVRNYLEEGASPQAAIADLNLDEDFVMDFDDAVKEPGSDSAKVLNRLIEAGVQRKLAVENQQRAVVEQQRSKEEDMLLEFQKDHNIPDDDFKEFVEWAKSETMTLEHMWHLKNKDQRDQNILKGSLKNRQEQIDKMAQTPRSLGQAGGADAPEPTPDEMVFNAIMTAGNSNLLNRD